MNTETLFSNYRPVEHYLRFIESGVKKKTEPLISFKAIDAFAMKQVALAYPRKPTVIDLAADGTQGATTLFWESTHPEIRQVIVPRLSGQTPEPGWLELFLEALDEFNIDLEPVNLSPCYIDQPDQWATLKSGLGYAPLLFSLAASPETFSSMLNLVLNLDADPLIFVLGIGALGESPIPEAVIDVCRANPAFRFRLMREHGPFFAHSQLGLIYQRESPAVSGILERIQRLFEGNFDFLSLAESNTKLRLDNKRLELKQTTPTQRQTESALMEGQPRIVFPETRRKLKDQPRLFRVRGAIGLWFIKLGVGTLGKSILPSGHLSYQVEFIGCAIPDQMLPRAVVAGTIELRSLDRYTWPTSHDSIYGVNASYHWLDENSNIVVKEGMRTPLDHTVQPGQVLTIDFNVLAPDQPGRYFLQPDLVHESFRWFSSATTAFPTFPIEVG